MTDNSEIYHGEVIGCDVDDISVQIHLPGNEDEDEFEDIDFPEDKRLLENYNNVSVQGPTDIKSEALPRLNYRRVVRRQLSAPANKSLGVNDELQHVPHPPTIVRRQTMPTNLIPEVCECPGEITFAKGVYDISPDSPTQIDITWNPPRNSRDLANLTYDIQLRKDKSVGWTPLSERVIPVLRVYTTETRFILDGEKYSFSNVPNEWKLQIRGVTKDSGAYLIGPWSCDVILKIHSVIEQIGKKAG